MSKNAVQACGLETSPCGVPRILVKVPGRIEVTEEPNPSYPACRHAASAQGERIAVGPSSSRCAIQCAVDGGTPRRRQLASIASLDTESKARRMSQLDMKRGV